MDNSLQINSTKNPIFKNNNLSNNENNNEENTLDNNYFKNIKTDGEIYSIALYNDNKTLILGDGEDTTYFIDIFSKKIISKKKLNKESISFLSFNHDYNYLLSASVDGELIIFNSKKSFEVLKKIQKEKIEIQWIEWNPKFSIFAFGYSNGDVFIYFIDNLNSFLNFKGNCECSCGKFNHEGNGLICCYEDGSCKIYDIKNGKISKNIKSDIGPILCMAITSQDYIKNIFVVGSSCDEIQFYSYEKGEIIFYQEYFNEDDNNDFGENIEEENNEEENNINIEYITFCYDNNYCAFCDSRCHLKLFDMKLLQIRSKFLFEENITKIIPSNTKREIIYISGTNGNIYIIDVRYRGKILNKIRQHSDTIMDFVVREIKDEHINSKDKQKSEIVISTSIDRSINLFKKEYI